MGSRLQIIVMMMSDATRLTQQRVAAVQQVWRPASARLRDQQSTGRGRDHRGNDGHQPRAGRRIGTHRVVRNSRYGIVTAVTRPPIRARGPQDPVDVRRCLRSDDRVSGEQGPGTDRHQGHRRGAVELTHRGIADIAASDIRVTEPVQARRPEEDEQPQSSDDPDHDAEDMQGRGQHREGGCGVGDDADAHHRRRTSWARTGARVLRRRQIIRDPPKPPAANAGHKRIRVIGDPWGPVGLSCIEGAGRRFGDRLSSRRDPEGSRRRVSRHHPTGVIRVELRRLGGRAATSLR